MEDIDRLRREIAAKESELADLNSQLALAESSKRAEDEDDTSSPWRWPLSREEYDRYGRQMVVPSFGLQGTFPWLMIYPKTSTRIGCTE